MGLECFFISYMKIRFDILLIIFFFLLKKDMIMEKLQFGIIRIEERLENSPSKLLFMDWVSQKR